MAIRNRGRAALTALLTAVAACSGGDARPEDAEHVQAMVAEHARDAPTANAADVEPGQPVVGEEVTYGTVDGRALTGYLARPQAAAGDLPALIVIHEWWGLNDNVRAMARRFAGEGYTVLAVDMYADQVAEEPARAQELMMQVMESPQTGVQNLQAAAEYLSQTARAARLGIVGWCFGGGWSLRGALAMPERIDAAVMYYGQPITAAGELQRLDAPLLGLFAAKDQGIPVAQVREMERSLQQLGKQAEVVVYPGTDHAFANPSGGNYDAAAAADAWQRATRFFAQHLKGGS